MSTEDAFLHAIFADPDDEATRLVYADWLEERNDPRADYIRTQVELKHPRLNAWKRRQLQIDLDAFHEHHGWLLHCGVPMTWEESLRRSLAETVAWCRDRVSLEDPVWCLRSRELAQVQDDWEEQTVFPHPTLVRQLITKRAQWLAHRGQYPNIRVATMYDGRMLLSDPLNSTCDEPSPPEGKSFINDWAIPPWDTWVFFPEHPGNQMLLSWIPPAFIHTIQDAVMAGHYTHWLDEIDTPYTQRIRHALNL